MNGSGSVLTSNLSGYGYWSADVYSSKIVLNVTNGTTTTTTTSTAAPTPTITLDSSTLLTACVALPGYFCYNPRQVEKELNGSSVQTTNTNVVISWKPCSNSTTCLPPANYTAWLGTVTATKTEVGQSYYPDVLDSQA